MTSLLSEKAKRALGKIHSQLRLYDTIGIAGTKEDLEDHYHIVRASQYRPNNAWVPNDA